MKLNNDFLKDEDGAVTVDWVVLTAAIIGLGVAVMTSVGAGSTDLADDVQSNLTNVEIASYLPVPTFGEVTFAIGQAVAGSCIQNEDGTSECLPGSSTVYETYSMSDGTSWKKTTHTVQGQDPVVTWVDGDGDDVDAPEATA